MADPPLPDGPHMRRVHEHRNRVRDTLRKVGAHHKFVAEQVRAETTAAREKLAKEAPT